MTKGSMCSCSCTTWKLTSRIMEVSHTTTCISIHSLSWAHCAKVEHSLGQWVMYTHKGRFALRNGEILAKFEEPQIKL